MVLSIMFCEKFLPLQVCYINCTYLLNGAGWKELHVISFVARNSARKKNGMFLGVVGEKDHNSPDVKKWESIQSFSTSSFVLTRGKVIIKVVLTNVVKPLFAYVHMLLVMNLLCLIGYVSYQYHADMQMFANIFCVLGGSISPVLAPVLWMNGGFCSVSCHQQR